MDTGINPKGVHIKGSKSSPAANFTKIKVQSCVLGSYNTLITSNTQQDNTTLISQSHAIQDTTINKLHLKLTEDKYIKSN